MESWYHVSWTVLFTSVIPLSLIYSMVRALSDNNVVAIKLLRNVTLIFNIIMVVVFITAQFSNDFCKYIGLPPGAFYVLVFVTTSLNLIAEMIYKLSKSNKMVVAEGGLS